MPVEMKSSVADRFVQVSPDRAYLVRVVKRDEQATVRVPLGADRDTMFKRVRLDLAALAVERVWLRKCPTRCIAGQSVESLAARLPAGIPVDGCPRCEGSPKRGWVVEACVCRGGYVHQEPGEEPTTSPPFGDEMLDCARCHGTGQHVERMGLPEALGSRTFARFANRLEADGDFVSSELHPAYHRGRTPDRLTVDDFRWLADALALLTEGAEHYV